MLTPWAGTLTLICCPVVLLWALRRRQGWLALSALAVMLVPLNSPFFEGGYARLIWANWFGAGASVIGNGLWWVGLWQSSIGVLLGLALLFAGLAFRQGGAGKRQGQLTSLQNASTGCQMQRVLPTLELRSASKTAFSFDHSGT